MNIHGKNLDILFETVLPYAFTFLAMRKLEGDSCSPLLSGVYSELKSRCADAKHTCAG